MTTLSKAEALIWMIEHPGQEIEGAVCADTTYARYRYHDGDFEAFVFGAWELIGLGSTNFFRHIPKPKPQRTNEEIASEAWETLCRTGEGKSAYLQLLDSVDEKIDAKIAALREEEAK